MKISKDVLLAFELLRGKLSDKPRRIEDLAVELGTTQGFLQQIVRKLRRAGFVEVTRGPGGGVRQGKARDQANLKSIVSAMNPGAIGLQFLQGGGRDLHQALDNFMESVKP